MSERIGEPIELPAEGATEGAVEDEAGGATRGAGSGAAALAAGGAAAGALAAGAAAALLLARRRRPRTPPPAPAPHPLYVAQPANGKTIHASDGTRRFSFKFVTILVANPHGMDFIRNGRSTELLNNISLFCIKIIFSFQIKQVGDAERSGENSISKPNPMNLT